MLVAFGKDVEKMLLVLFHILSTHWVLTNFVLILKSYIGYTQTNTPYYHHFFK